LDTPKSQKSPEKSRKVQKIFGSPEISRIVQKISPEESGKSPKS